ncbi:MAG: hypothetical protein HC894_27135 [Microcoleus sp. SM1_3_4]|nr:hypothetical protein [Microcoleus sp. SM1_3_4]
MRKIEATNLSRLGFKTPFQSPEIKQKIRATNLSRYGVANPMKLEEIKQKIRNTNLKNYGVDCLLRLKEVRDKGWAVIKKNKSFNKSKEELVFWEHLKWPVDPQTEHHVEHPEIHNIMDFYSPKYDLWMQFDGAYWHGKLWRFNVTRQALKIMKTMARDQYQNEHVPNLIRFWSDDVASAIKNNTISELIKTQITEKIEGKAHSHQYHKKIEWLEQDLKILPFNPATLSAKDFDLSAEPLSKEIVEFIQKYEWLGTMGVSPKWCFTARYRGILSGVVLINEPTAYSTLMGENTPKYEALIQRGATISWAPKNLGSRLVRYSCKWMVNNSEKRAFVAYADPEANEIGTIYQACGFEYLGKTFGSSTLYRHPQIKNGCSFSSQSLKRTSAFKRWCKHNGIIAQRGWFKENVI